MLGDELGLGRVGGLPGVGRQAGARRHRGDRARQGRQDQTGDPRRGRRSLARAGVPLESRVARRIANSSTSGCSRTGGSSYGEEASLAQRGALRVRLRGRDDRRRDRPDRAAARGVARASPTSRRATPTTRRRPRRACSSASTTWRCSPPTPWPNSGRCVRSSSPSSRASGSGGETRQADVADHRGRGGGVSDVGPRAPSRS